MIQNKGKSKNINQNQNLNQNQTQTKQTKTENQDQDKTKPTRKRKLSNETYFEQFEPIQLRKTKNYIGPKPSKIRKPNQIKLNLNQNLKIDTETTIKPKTINNLK